MKQDIAQLWTADLRTNPAQAYGLLHNGVGHCCLGRLCIVLNHTFITREYFNGSIEYVVADENLILPESVQKEAGMQSQNGHAVIYLRNPTTNGEYPVEFVLSDLNDSYLTPSQIADVIDFVSTEL